MTEPKFWHDPAGETWAETMCFAEGFNDAVAHPAISGTATTTKDRTREML
jgi:hypothetical protein